MGFFRDGLLSERKDHELLDYWQTLLPQMEHLDELGGFQLLEIRSSLPTNCLCTPISYRWPTASKHACHTSTARL